LCSDALRRKPFRQLRHHQVRRIAEFSLTAKRRAAPRGENPLAAASY
jgi:hypothetical protein